MTFFASAIRFTCGAMCLASALVITGCDSEQERVRWVSLAEDFVPQTEIVDGELWEAPFFGGDKLTLHNERGGNGVWITATLKTEDWELAPIGTSVWKARRPTWGIGLPVVEDRLPQQLEDDDRKFSYVPFTNKILKEELDEGTFTGVLEFVYLKTDGERPGELRYTVFAERGRPVNGRWRVGIERYLCDGFPLWSGHSEEITTDIPYKSVLTFGVAGTATSRQLGEAAGTVTVRVLLDGSEVHRHEQPVQDFVQASRHSVEIPWDERTGAKFTFEITGPAAICAILDPRLRPVNLGELELWEPRPIDSAPKRNVLLFLADTFRADNLTAYGANYSESLTPNLDSFANESVVFARAWSPASWTLPAQASMMSGLYPGQHGADESKRQIADEITTLAEAFENAGYRTGAITDSLFVSQRFGFDQGFQWFDESTRTLEDTLDEVNDFLSADDGRPFFLFVQTYRTHTPYLASETTRRDYADVLELGPDWITLHGALVARTEAWNPSEPIPDELKLVISRIEQLYRGGVVDLDRGFGALLDQLDIRGLNQNTWLVFTSDHGESFGEHERMFHGNGVWESDVRIPLIIRGPDQKPARIEAAATLVDLPRTLAALGGVAPSLRWGGQNLLGTLADRPAYSFECPASGEPGLAAMMERPHKVIFENSSEAIEGRATQSAYDLSYDPLELQDLGGKDVGWDEHMFERNSIELNGLRRELFRAPRARLRPEDIENLAAVGYVDDE